MTSCSVYTYTIILCCFYYSRAYGTHICSWGARVPFAYTFQFFLLFVLPVKCVFCIVELVHNTEFFRRKLCNVTFLQKNNFFFSFSLPHSFHHCLLLFFFSKEKKVLPIFSFNYLNINFLHNYFLHLLASKVNHNNLSVDNFM